MEDKPTLRELQKGSESRSVFKGTLIVEPAKPKIVGDGPPASNQIINRIERRVVRRIIKTTIVIAVFGISADILQHWSFWQPEKPAEFPAEVSLALDEVKSGNEDIKKITQHQVEEKEHQIAKLRDSVDNLQESLNNERRTTVEAAARLSIVLLQLDGKRKTPGHEDLKADLQFTLAEVQRGREKNGSRPSYAEMLGLAALALSDGNMEAAREHLSTIERELISDSAPDMALQTVSARSDFARYFGLMSEISFSYGHWQEAEAHLKALLDLTPSNFDALWKLAICYECSFLFSKSIAVCDQALDQLSAKNQPSSGLRETFLIVRATANLALNQFTRCISDANAVLQAEALSPDLALVATILLSQATAETQSPHLAVEAVARNRQKWIGAEQRGLATLEIFYASHLVSAGNSSKAMLHLEKVRQSMHSAPESLADVYLSTRYLICKADALQFSNKRPEAIETLGEAVSTLEAWHSRDHYDLGPILSDVLSRKASLHQDPSEAIQLQKEAIRIFEQSSNKIDQQTKCIARSNLHLVLAALHAVSGDMDAAFDSLAYVKQTTELLLGSRSHLDNIWSNILNVEALIFKRKGNYAQALQRSEDAITHARRTEHLPSLAKALLTRLHTEFVAGITPSDALLNEAIDLTEQCPNAVNPIFPHCGAALAYSIRFRNALALRDRELQQDDQNTINVDDGLSAVALYQRGQHVDSPAVLLNNTAYLLASNGDPAQITKALSYARVACELTHYEHFEILNTLAFVYSRSGDLENAIKWQERANDVAGGNVTPDSISRLQHYRSEYAPRRVVAKPAIPGE